MKEEMSSVDIRYVVRELQGLVGSRIDKVYHDGDEIRIKLRTREGRADLMIQAGKRFHLTSYIKEAPKRPSGFTMLLRKHLGGGFIDAIEQHQFDRIVKLKVGDYTLIGELFRRGNIILVDSDGRIVAALRYEEYKDRIIKPKAEYKFPPARENPLDVSLERFVELMREEDELELVRALARKLNMGGMYAEEILLRAGFEKTKPVGELSDRDLEEIYDSMMKTFNDEPKPNIVYKEGMMHDVVPIELRIYEGFERRYFKTFSEALDEYFGRLTVERARLEKTKKLEAKKRQFLMTLKKQEEMLEGFKRAMEENQRIGDLIYANYSLVEKLLEELRAAIERLGWKEFMRRVEEARKSSEGSKVVIKSADPGEKAVTVELDGFNVKLYLNKSLGENAELYYERAKKFRHKYEGALKAYEDTRKKLEEVEKLIEEEMKEEVSVKKIERRKRRWFEKFRWFISSEGFLVLAGKDAGTNEILIKRHMDEGDVYCHADVYGAPHVVIKKGKEASEETLKEACQFAVSMSKAWSRGLYSADAYWADPTQVTKQTPSGEYLGKGAFMVYGKRNWFHGLPLELAVGIIEYEGEKFVVCAPVEAMRAHSDRFIVIRPGRMKKGELVKRIRKILEGWGYKVREEDLNAILPPGGGEIAGIRGS